MKFHAPVMPVLSRHEHIVRVYYEDTDAGGIVYHASYLRFAERARTEALRDAGAPHAELIAQHGLIFVVRRVNIEYLRPARLDDSLCIVTQTLAMGRATARMRQSFLVYGQTPEQKLAVLEVDLACIRAADGRPARVPQRWCVALGRVAPGDASDRVEDGSDNRAAMQAAQERKDGRESS